MSNVDDACAKLQAIIDAATDVIAVGVELKNLGQALTAKGDAIESAANDLKQVAEQAKADLTADHSKTYEQLGLSVCETHSTDIKNFATAADQDAFDTVTQDGIAKQKSTLMTSLLNDVDALI